MQYLFGVAYEGHPKKFRKIGVQKNSRPKTPSKKNFGGPKNVAENSNPKKRPKIIPKSYTAHPKLIPKKQSSKKIKMKRFAIEFFGRLSGQVFGQKPLFFSIFFGQNFLVQKIGQTGVQKI